MSDAALPNPSPPLDASPEITEMVERLTEDVCRDVCELSDRTSPDDWPEAMLVTGDELSEIIKVRLDALLRRLGEREARMPDFTKMAADLDLAELWTRQVARQPPSRVAPGIAKAAVNIATGLRLTRAALAAAGKEGE